MPQMSKTSRKTRHAATSIRTHVRQKIISSNIRTTTSCKERDHLLLLATRRFCDEHVHDRLSLENYKEAFYALVGKVEKQTLAEVSSLLSANPFAPKEAVLYLATESVDIARPILRRSQVLNQLDMIGLVEKCSFDHISVLTTRVDLGPSVEKCIRRMNNKILNINLDRRPTEIGAGKGKSADRMFEKITATRLETAAESKTPSVANKENGLPKQGVTKTAQHSLIAAASRGGRLPENTSIRAESKRTPTSHSAVLRSNFGAALEQAALARSRQTLAMLMQNRFELALDTCHTVLADKTGDTLAVLMKGADLDNALANRISLLTFPNVGLSVHNTKRAMRYYAKLETASCLEAMAQWPKQKNTTARHETVLADDRHERPVASGALAATANETTLAATG